jgi:nitroreductase
MDLFDLIRERRSCRVFKADPVPQEVIEEILSWAGKAPSAINVQPWEFIVISGREKQRLADRLLKAQREKRVSCGPGTSRPLPEPWIGRQRELFKVMNFLAQEIPLDLNTFITEGSCRFYDAPVALLICLDQLFPTSRLLCMGMALGYLFLAAQAKGLATCPIGLITAYEEEIKDHLNIPEDKQVLLGVALGIADESPMNRFKSSREDVSSLIRWIS